MSEHNPAAFPGVSVSPHGITEAQGMTLRDYFAGLAMQGTLADRGSWPFGYDKVEILANSSYDIAEAMLEVREQRTAKSKAD